MRRASRPKPPSGWSRPSPPSARLPLIKRPGIAESIDWARAAQVLHRDGASWPDALKRSLGLIVKDQEDLDVVREAELI